MCYGRRKMHPLLAREMIMYYYLVFTQRAGGSDLTAFNGGVH